MREGPDIKSKLQQFLQPKTGVFAFWLEGVDPPKRQANAANVTMLVVANPSLPTRGARGPDFGFMLATTRMQKKRERERDCAQELLSCMEILPLDDSRAWCRLMATSADGHSTEAVKDLAQLTNLAKKRVPKVTLDLVEPGAYVPTSWQSLTTEKGVEPEALLERFDVGCGELMREARRVGGIVRQQWFVSLVIARPGPGEGVKPFTLGAGLATDAALARTRALYAAEHRVALLTTALFAANGEEEPAAKTAKK